MQPIIIAALTGLISVLSGNCAAALWKCVDSAGNTRYINTDPSKPHYECLSENDPEVKNVVRYTDGPGCIYVPPYPEGICRPLVLDPLMPSPKSAQNISPPQAQAKKTPQPKQRQESKKLSGTGFYVSGDGYLITNAHVVDACHTINAIDGTAQRTPLRVVRVLQTDDLALLKSNNAPKAFAVFRESSRINQGEAVVAYGFPLAGLLASGGNVSTGLVTALAGLRDDARQMQISAPVQPGNSGGPLIDSRGLVIGVIVSKLDAIAVARLTSDIPQNINFAIKSSSVINLLDMSSVKYQSEKLQRDLSVETLTQQVKEYTVRIECN